MTPSAGPTVTPSAVPTVTPSAARTVTSSAIPTVTPTVTPSAVPTVTPTAVPTGAFTDKPSKRSSTLPSASPSLRKGISPDLSQSPTKARSTHNFTQTRSCFAGSDSVTLECGDVSAISDVKVGDRVLAANAAGKTLYSEVVFVPHGANMDSTIFAHISTVGGHDVKITGNHVLPAGVCGTSLPLPLVYASKVSVGVCLQTVSGEEEVSEVHWVRAEGVYTIVTNEEYIVVNGIIASPFGVNHMMANMYYNVHRFLYVFFPSLISSPLTVLANEVRGNEMKGNTMR